MTREEAIICLKGIKNVGHDIFTEQRDFQESLNIAIQALEQEPILDKIRAEITEYGSIWVEYKITGKRDKDIEQLVSDILKQAKEQVLEIIDKYKAESKTRNNNRRYKLEQKSNTQEILKLIKDCDETSATRCFTCINEIKERYKR
jgi:hypothetical protein